MQETASRRPVRTSIERVTCAACAEETRGTRCAACGEDPLLDGRYRLLRVLGRGASGTTWLAEVDGCQVAIKESLLHKHDAAKARELVEREARVLRQLSHPGIPAYVDHLVAGKGKARSLYLVQEHVEGTDLQRHLEQHRYDEREVLQVLRELCGILGYLHGLAPPVVHRDLKPANVLRRPDGRLVLVDFGSVRDVLRDAQLGGSTVAGTFGYMAPEQFAGDAEPRSDLYGLGALAVALLTRRDPATLHGPDRKVRWRQHARVSGATAGLIDDLLALDPARRPANAEAVAERISRILSGERAPIRWWLPAMVLTGLAAGGAAVIAWPEPPPPPPPAAAEEVAVVPPLRQGLWPAMTEAQLAELPDVVTCDVVRIVGAAGLEGVDLGACLPPFREAARAWAETVAQPDEVGALEHRLTWDLSARPPDALIVERTSNRWVGEQGWLPEELVRDAEVLARPAPSYPEAARGLDLAPVQCRTEVSVHATGVPFHVQVSDCPLAYHQPVIDALASWRWRPGEEAFRTPVTLTFRQTGRKVQVLGSSE